MTKSILYIVNSYGTPPLNYFEKYIKENRMASITICKLPAIRSAKNKININAFIKDEENNIHEINLNLFFPFPYFLIFLLQYLINFILLFILLSKIKRKKFDIVIGETNFGSCISWNETIIGNFESATTIKPWNIDIFRDFINWHIRDIYIHISLTELHIM